MASSFVHDSVQSSIIFPTCIPWQTLSSDLSDKLKHGSLRITRNNTVEYAAIHEEGERVPLLNGKSRDAETELGGSAVVGPRGVSWMVASFLLINAALGTGILNFPAAYSRAGGVMMGTIIQLLLIGFVMSTMVVLAYCSDINGDSTYHDTLFSMCGRRAQQLSAVSITTTCYGISVAIFIIIGDQYDKVFDAVFGTEFCNLWFLNRHYTISVTAVLFVLPLCFFQRLDFLRYAGSLGIFAMIYPVLLTVYEYFVSEPSKGRIKHGPDSAVDVFVSIPVFCLAYQCHEVVVPVYSCMKERNLPNFIKSILLAMSFLIVLYSLIGSFGYLTFGSLVASDIMSMYDARDPAVLIGVAALIIKMIVTYPTLALCGRGAVDGLYAEFAGLTASEFIKGEKRRRVIIATLWFITSLILANFIPTLGVVIEMLGAVSVANIFIFPGVCLFVCINKQDPEMKIRRNRFLLMLSIFLTAFGTFLSSTILTQVFMYDLEKGLNDYESVCS